MNIERHTDLFSIQAVKQAVQGAEWIYYDGEVPDCSARLVQGRVEDLTILCADTIGRAAALAGVSYIGYAAGRSELSGVLEAYGIPGGEGTGTGTVLRGKKWKSGNTVHSVQCFRLPAGRDAAWVGEEYMKWLPKELYPFVQVRKKEGGVFHFCAALLPAPLLVLMYSEADSMPGCEVYRITGGILANRKETEKYTGRLEFREIVGTGEIITAIHHFVPRLPWPLYRLTQAIVHLWVMERFGRYLSRIK